MSKPAQDEQYLVELTRESLVEVLGREPTRQEVWKAHAGFKRMAFLLLDHLDSLKRYENKNRDETTDPEILGENDEETINPKRALGEAGEYPA